MFWAKKIVRRVKLSGVDITFFANSVAHSTVYVPIGVVEKEVLYATLVVYWVRLGCPLKSSLT